MPRNHNSDSGLDAFVFLAAAMGGGLERAVEESERNTQSSLVNSDVLPTRFDGREVLERAGVRFGDVVAGDSLFRHVELPQGWKKCSTSHAMWSDLVDDRGRKRASIFYKGAFYDRAAHGSVCRRFSVESYYNDDHKTVAVARVKDGDSVLFESERLKIETDEDRYGSDKVKSKRRVAQEQCETWLHEHWPNWQSSAEYWD